uniref:Uncharacterized protein n=1 Tax=Romanomermis culicivorax TaxID=13658 RepID=A0A915IVF5_ROMCU
MYSLCCSDICKTVTNLFIKEEQVASWDGTTALIDLRTRSSFFEGPPCPSPNTYSCSMLEQQCKEENEQAV